MDELGYEWEPEEDPEHPEPFDEEHHLLIMQDRCSSCVFRPGNLMQLRSGRLRDLVEQTHARDTNVLCHQTIMPGSARGALCAGSVEEREGQLVRIFQRLGDGIRYVAPGPPKTNGEPSSAHPATPEPTEP